MIKSDQDHPKKIINKKIKNRIIQHTFKIH
jgi:hypothetical protein